MITAIVSGNQGMPLIELLNSQGRFTPDDVFMLVARSELFVDIRSYPLVEPEQLPVFTDKFHSQVKVTPLAGHIRISRGQSQFSAEIGNAVSCDGQPFVIINVGEGYIWLQSIEHKLIKLPVDDFEELVKRLSIKGLSNARNHDNEVYKIIKGKAPEELNEGHTRFEAIKHFLSGSRDIRPSRTEYRWIENYKLAEMKYGCGFIGLLPNKSHRGNSNQKLPKESIDLMTDCIKSDYLDITQKKIKPVFGKYLNRCKELNIIPASYKTFCIHIAEIDADKKAKRDKESGRHIRSRSLIGSWN